MRVVRGASGFDWGPLDGGIGRMRSALSRAPQGSCSGGGNGGPACEEGKTSDRRHCAQDPRPSQRHRVEGARKDHHAQQPKTARHLEGSAGATARGPCEGRERDRVHLLVVHPRLPPRRGAGIEARAVNPPSAQGHARQSEERCGKEELGMTLKGPFVRRHDA